MEEDGEEERMMEIDGRGGGDDGNGWERRRVLRESTDLHRGQ